MEENNVTEERPAFDMLNDKLNALVNLAVDQDTFLRSKVKLMGGASSDLEQKDPSPDAPGTPNQNYFERYDRLINKLEMALAGIERTSRRLNKLI